MRIIQWGLALVLLVPGGIAAAQEQPAQQPQASALAEAARRTRDQKKDQAKPAHVWDNDNIPNSPGNISIVGQGSAASAAESPAGNGGSAANPPSTDQAATPATAGPSAEKSAEEVSALQAELDNAKDQLKSLQKDLDILQRKFTLDQQMYMGKPDYSSDKAGAAQIKQEETEVAAKTREVADSQKKADELQKKLDAAKANTPSKSQ